MAALYKDRLIAIQQLLASPHQEEVEEGYDSLFNLWLENSDSTDLVKELAPIAQKNPGIIQELDNRLDMLSVTDSFTDTFLRNHLRALISEVERLNQKEIESSGSAISTSVRIVAVEKPQKRLEWWKLAMFGIIIVSTLLLFFLPDLYQKALVFLTAGVCLVTLPYIFPKKDNSILIASSSVKLTYSFPTYLSVGDENTVHISIENLGREEFKGKITLVFDDPGSFVTPSPDQNLSVNVDVTPHGREAKQFKFLVAKKPPDKDLNYYFHVSSNGLQYETNEEKFLITPIPYLRSTWAWFFGGAGVLVALLWKQLEKLLGI